MWRRRRRNEVTAFPLVAQFSFYPRSLNRSINPGKSFRFAQALNSAKSENPRSCYQMPAPALPFTLASASSLLLFSTMSEGHSLALTQAQLVSSLLGYCGLGQFAFPSNPFPTLRFSSPIRMKLPPMNAGVAIACFIPLIRQSE